MILYSPPPPRSFCRGKRREASNIWRPWQQTIREFFSLSLLLSEEMRPILPNGFPPQAVQILTWKGEGEGRKKKKVLFFCQKLHIPTLKTKKSPCTIGEEKVNLSKSWDLVGNPGSRVLERWIRVLDGLSPRKRDVTRTPLSVVRIIVVPGSWRTAGPYWNQMARVIWRSRSLHNAWLDELPAGIVCIARHLCITDHWLIFSQPRDHHHHHSLYMPDVFHPSRLFLSLSLWFPAVKTHTWREAGSMVMLPRPLSFAFECYAYLNRPTEKICGERTERGGDFLTHSGGHRQQLPYRLALKFETRAFSPSLRC